jgi:hypothetical protein
MGGSSDEEDSGQGYFTTNQPSRSTMSSPPRSSSKSTGKKTPTSSTKRQSSTIPSSVAFSGGDDDDGLADAMSKVNVEDGDGTKTGSSAADKQDGTAKNPFVLFVDPKHLGRTHPFVILRIENQLVGTTTRNVWEILMMAEHPGEVDRYKAKVSSPSSLTVTMPSIPGWLLDDGKLSSMRTCATTGSQYKAWIADYLKGGNQSVVFLIHFPSGTTLDNSLFGRDGQLDKEVLYMSDDLVGGGGTLKLFASGLRWKIAELGLRNLEAVEPRTDVYGGFAAKYGGP